jgi:glutaconate CoA-transferase subunit A
MAIIREIVRQKKKDLTIITATGVIDVDLLIGAGCVKKVLASYVGFDAFGFAPNFQRAVQSGKIRMEEFSEFTLHTAIRGGRMGVPFLPVRSLHRSDLLSINPSYKKMRCPFSGEELIAVRSLSPDFAILHLQSSDEHGNIQMKKTQGIDFEINLAKASKNVIVSVEEILPSEMKNPSDTIINHFEVDRVLHIPQGASPCGFFPFYHPDTRKIAEYIFSASSPRSFERYLKKYIYELHER